MLEIAELEQRISAAFDRMDRGLDAVARARAAASALSEMPADGPEPALPEPALPEPALPEPALPEPALTEPAPQMAALLRALESAKSSSAEWAERYRTLEQQSAAETLAMAAEIARLTDLLAAAKPPADPSHRDSEIDDLTARLAQQEAELETLRALRSAEAAEIGDLVAALAPLVQEAPHV